jgi:hypothetical protein
LRDNDVVEGLALVAEAGESDLDHHCCCYWDFEKGVWMRD